MFSISRMTIAVLAVSACCLVTNLCLGAVDVGVLTKVAAQEKYGITMHGRKIGEGRITVWIEFKKTGWLEKFTYAELRMDDQSGKQILSALLQPTPIYNRQANDLTTVAFSAGPEQLAQCSFFVVCYGSNEGDVGYVLKIKDFLDLKSDFPDMKPEDGPSVNTKKKL